MQSRIVNFASERGIMAQSNWEADKMLDVYIYDYLVKKKLHNTAKAFMTEGKVSPDPVAIDAPGGFLFEWWSVFWDIFIARTNEKHSETAAAYLEAQQNKVKEQQQLQMQQLQLIRQAQLQRRDSNHPPLGGPVNSITTEGVLGQSTASALAAKMYEERMKHSNPMDTETSQPLLDARMALLKSTNHPGLEHSKHLYVLLLLSLHLNSFTSSLYKITMLIFHFLPQQDIKGEVNMGAMQRSLPMDPSSIYGQGGMQSKPGIANTGLNAGVGSLTLKGWPLTGIDQIRPGFGAPVQKPLLQSANQFQLLPQQQQQLLAQVQAQGNIGNSPVYGDMDPQRLRGLTRGSLNAKDGQSIANDGSIGSPMQSTSSKKFHLLCVNMIILSFLMQINMPQIQQSTSQQQQDPLHPQQLMQNNRKRKGPTSSGPANSTGTGNTLGPSNSQPSTPSTHTPGDGVAMAGNLQNVAGVSKGLMMYGTDGAGGLASSTNQLDDMEHFGDVGSLEDNVESFLSQDDGDGRDLFGTLKRNPSEHATDASKGFSFSEVSSIRKSNSKVVCCHFSSDGKLLASAGHDKKVVLWNMETLQTESTPEEHSLIITDVRFRPNSTQLATSSFDTTVRLWDAADPTFSLQAYSGHTSHVVSLDFHPKKNDLFCSCDDNNEIRFWNISQYSCTRVFKGGSTQVRFQPRVGQLLAAASGSLVSVFDVETDRQMNMFQGHSADVHCVCWDTNGDYLASVSQESVKVWSLASGECIHELNSSGNMYHSCVFHPSYSTLLVIGGYQVLILFMDTLQSLELWNMVENRCMTIPAHECVISALAQSPVTGMVASASHDKSVKIWK
ncbi:Ca2+/calmodulin-dependent protein kinase [Vigna unguiculata]|uniref:Ca2+/calmodulin-dependent protein kinase n=1 Tax=Vigna unguiculata TaxID=3917 RepID=A0A4D6MXU4_VIGUN|nr:Ca2+/calmodulin-dependent protein kinase [Vigna unguiculata]